MMRSTQNLILFSLLVVVFFLLAGCSQKMPDAGDYTPPADKARQSLDAALAHWKNGGQPGVVPNTSPQVDAVDSKWKSGQKIREYEILGEDSSAASGTSTRFFKVRLTTTKSPTQEVRYVVVGIEPIWVYREEDYKALSEMGK